MILLEMCLSISSESSVKGAARPKMSKTLDTRLNVRRSVKFFVMVLLVIPAYKKSAVGEPLHVITFNSMD